MDGAGLLLGISRPPSCAGKSYWLGSELMCPARFLEISAMLSCSKALASYLPLRQSRILPESFVYYVVHGLGQAWWAALLVSFLFQLLENIEIAWEAETPPMLLGTKKGVAE